MKVLLVDDHAVVCAGLRGLLTAAIVGVEVHEVATGEDALALMPKVRPHLVILDLNLPGLGGLELLRRLLREDGTARILVLSMHAEVLYVVRAIEAGARGYVSKNASPDELCLAVRRVAEGGRYIEGEIAQELALLTVSAGGLPLRQLTGRELEILRLLANGRSMTEIADALAVSYKTVANTCTGIKAKLGVSRTADLIRLATEAGLTATG